MRRVYGGSSAHYRHVFFTLAARRRGLGAGEWRRPTGIASLNDYLMEAAIEVFLIGLAERAVAGPPGDDGTDDGDRGRHHTENSGSKHVAIRYRC